MQNEACHEKMEKLAAPEKPEWYVMAIVGFIGLMVGVGLANEMKH